MQQLLKVRKWIEYLINSNKVAFEEPWSLLPLQGDASCRCYFRLNLPSASMIVVASPVQKIDNAVFVNIARHWAEFTVKVPEVYQVESQLGLMLIEDFGEQHLYDVVANHYKDDLYELALDQLQLIQQTPNAYLPSFDRPFLLREMTLFDTWLVQYQLDLAAPPSLLTTYEVLIENALEQPQVTMHRDFHSRNLLLAGGKIAVIDFQDAVKGPLAYDLVSLLKDCYITLEPEQVDCLISVYLKRLNTSSLLDKHIDKQQFIKWFDLIGMQRHLKVLGLFIRLGVEDEKSSYLKHLPRVFNYVLGVTVKYTEFAEFHIWLKDTVQPELQKQCWYLS
ncbi:MAG: phosphotransferase [Oceanospirillaceae bacterium]